jgi:hypothetical protein
MLNFLRGILGKKSNHESGRVDFSDWIIKDYLELSKIPDRKVEGAIVKIPAQEHFAKYAEYETDTGYPYAPSVAYGDLNVLFYPLFMVVENSSTSPEACFIVIVPNKKLQMETKLELQRSSLIAESDSETFMLPLCEFIGSKMEEIERRFR